MKQRVGEARRAPGNKRLFHGDDALGAVLLGGGGQKSKTKVAGYQRTGRLRRLPVLPAQMNGFFLFTQIPLQKNTMSVT